MFFHSGSFFIWILRGYGRKEQKENSGSDILKLTDGSTWVECEVNVIYDYTQMPTDKIIRFKNISKLKNQNDELTYMAYYDVMTGLYNRNYFVRLLADFVRRAEEENTVVSVMFIDVDDFSKINDGFGLAVGDEVVQQFGQFVGMLLYAGEGIASVFMFIAKLSSKFLQRSGSLHIKNSCQIFLPYNMMRNITRCNPEYGNRLR